MIVPPVELPFDEPTTCLTVNKTWASYMLGLLDRGSKEKYWDENTYDGAQGIEQIIAALINGNCVEMPVYTLEARKHVHKQAQNVSGGGISANVWTPTPINYRVMDDGTYSLSTSISVPEMTRVTFSANHVMAVATGSSAFAQMRVKFDWSVGNRIFYGAQRQYISRGIVFCNGNFISPDVNAQIIVDVEVRQSVAQATNALGIPRNLAGEEEIYGELALSWIVAS